MPIASQRLGKVDLRPHQVANTRRITDIFKEYDAALDSSDTGTGKTYTALAVAKRLKRVPYIVCPKAVIPAWEAAAEDIGLKQYAVSNYEKLRAGKTPDYQAYKGSKGYNRYRWHLPQDRYMFIFDEVHRCRNVSLQSRMFNQAVIQKYKTLLLSATPFTSPLDLRYIGRALGLHRGANFYQWCRNFGCFKGTWGWEFNGDPKYLEQVQRYISPRVVRTKREDIPNFPETTIQPTLYDFGDRFRIAEATYSQELENLEEDRDMLNGAVRYQFYRMKTEMIKVPTLVDQVRAYNLEGFKVVLFFSFLRSIEEFRILYDEPVTVISGLQKDPVSEFQKGGSGTMAAVCQYAAGGAGISLHGPGPRIAILNPTPSALELKQALGRIHRLGGETTIQKILFAAGTIEERVYKSVKEKVDNIDRLNDGDVSYYGEILDDTAKDALENEVQS